MKIQVLFDHIPHRLFASIAALSLAAAVALPAQAAVTTTWSAAAPDAATVIATSDVGATSNAFGARWISSTNHRDISQSFLATEATTLDSFTFRQTHDQRTNAELLNIPFTVKIYEVASATALPDSSGSTLVSTQSGNWTVPGGTAASTYITFNIESVALKANTHYSFVLGFDQSGSKVEFLGSTYGNSVYPQGVAAGLTYNDGVAGAWGAWATDFVFYASTSSIPEPAVTALLLGGLGLLAVGIYKRRS
ncbi:hypothetical protein OpiT1DRAFT_01821 [Opitutaceae bacterium TAV1]|nr:hypothetical protein OpiT1DRAFT_01821 [Opitutaceae bacterium TAV1]